MKILLCNLSYVSVELVSTGPVYTEYAPSNCFIAGWGETAENLASNQLLSVDVDIYSDQYCYCDTAMADRFNPSYEFCAGKVDGGKDSCTGDRGGPLICINEGNEPVLYGVGSWGEIPAGCGVSNYPGIYAKVSSDIDWIIDTIDNHD